MDLTFMNLLHESWSSGHEVLTLIGSLGLEQCRRQKCARLKPNLLHLTFFVLLLWWYWLLHLTIKVIWICSTLCG